MEQIAEDRNKIYKTSVYANANGQKMEYDYLRVNGVPYPVDEYFIYDILNNSDLFTDGQKERLQGASAATIRGEIQAQLNKGRRPKYYKNKDIKVTQKIHFPFMETLQGSGTHTKKVY